MPTLTHWWELKNTHFQSLRFRGWYGSFRVQSLLIGRVSRLSWGMGTTLYNVLVPFYKTLILNCTVCYCFSNLQKLVHPLRKGAWRVFSYLVRVCRTPFDTQKEDTIWSRTTDKVLGFKVILFTVEFHHQRLIGNRTWESYFVSLLNF